TSGRRWLDKGICSTVWLMWRLRWAYWRGTTAEHLAGQYQMKPVRVIIFAKAPIPGLAKTRLIPSLGKDGAAVLARRFLYRTLEESLAAAIGTVELCATPEPSHACWRAIGMPAGTVLSAQGEGDLGLRM